MKFNKSIINEAWLIKQIKNCQELLDFYEFKTSELSDCRLCRDTHPFCHNCLWGLFEGITCTRYYADYINSSELVATARTERMPEWTEARIPMLKRWIRCLNKRLYRWRKAHESRPD